MLGSAPVLAAGDYLLRIGAGPIAAGVAAVAIGFIGYLFLTTAPAPANAGLRAESRTLPAFGSADRKLAFSNASIGSDTRTGFNARWTSVEDTSKFTSDERDGRTEARSASSPFGERFSLNSSFGDRFAFDDGDLRTGSFQRTASFDDRFGREFAPADATARSSGANQRVAAAVPLPRAAARTVAPKRPQDGRFQVASASSTSLPMAFAPTDSVKGSASVGAALRDPMPKASKAIADSDMSKTAIYDISAKTVYLPSGRRLEAHSGLGGHMDDVRYVNMRMTGPTPPNVYDLKMREAPFKGDRAIRLIPTDGSTMYGRDGILAHSYLMGPSGQSNGCVSFSDYPAFLNAFLRGEITRIVVVDRLQGDPPPPQTASDWFKDLFRRS